MSARLCYNPFRFNRHCEAKQSLDCRVALHAPRNDENELLQDSNIGDSMKKALFILALCLASFTAHAEERVVPLEGNAELRLGGNNGRAVYRGYDTDDLIYRRLVNPHAGSRNRIRNIPTNDMSAICGHIERDRKRERCVEDVMEEREKLIRRYND
jgi:hypothetical protein